MAILGIDVSKDDFHACLIQGSKHSRKSFPNNGAGYRQLLKWLTNCKCTEVHACMEATGAYWLGLASAISAAEIRVSVVNPSRIALFARSQLRRTKTDRVDAEIIAEFCQTQKPDLWTPPAPETLELRALLTYRTQLVSQRAVLKQLATQMEMTTVLEQVHNQQIDSLSGTIKALEDQMRALVKRHKSLKAAIESVSSIPGVAFISAASIVARLPLERLRNAKAAAAYAGLTPSERQSGTSVHGKPRICKTGNSELRRDLFMPALVAMRFNPILARFAERLKAKGKPAKVVIVAVMRKLLVLAFALMKSGTTFNPAIAAQSA